jgi:hypothetical protein
VKALSVQYERKECVRMMKYRLLFVAVLAVVILGASSASACERCLNDPAFPNLGYSCWSGYDTGYSWCYGGGTKTCTKPVAYNCPARDPLAIAPPDEGVRRMTPALNQVTGVLGCTDCGPGLGNAMNAPDGGFDLEL